MKKLVKFLDRTFMVLTFGLPFLAMLHFSLAHLAPQPEFEMFYGWVYLGLCLTSFVLWMVVRLNFEK